MQYDPASFDSPPADDLEKIKEAIRHRADRMCRLLDLKAPLIVLNHEHRLLHNASSAAVTYAIQREKELGG